MPMKSTEVQTLPLLASGAQLLYSLCYTCMLAVLNATKYIIAERLSTRHWIADSGQRWQQVLHVYIHVRHTCGMQLNFYVT